MKVILAIFIWALIFSTGLQSCGDSLTKNEPSVTDTTSAHINSDIPEKGSNDIFKNPNIMVSVLSQNGIGELKQWSNPMEMGWGSLTDYYQFGDRKDGVGMQNNISYYLEGDETTVKEIMVSLNINNPADKKNALRFLSEVSEKTFKSLSLELPKGLINAIMTSKAFKANISNFTTSVELDKSKIETWKVSIIKK